MSHACTPILVGIASPVSEIASTTFKIGQFFLSDFALKYSIVRNGALNEKETKQ